MGEKRVGSRLALEGEPVRPQQLEGGDPLSQGGTWTELQRPSHQPPSSRRRAVASSSRTLVPLTLPLCHQEGLICLSSTSLFSCSVSSPRAVAYSRVRLCFLSLSSSDCISNHLPVHL